MLPTGGLLRNRSIQLTCNRFVPKRIQPAVGGDEIETRAELMTVGKSVPKPKTYRNGPPHETETRKRIVSGVRRLFFTHGLRAVTMDELAEELGVSKKTLYTHFPSKAALVEAGLLDKFQEIEAELEVIVSASESDLPTSLQRVLACFQRHMGEIHPPFVRDIQRQSPRMFEGVEARRRALMQRYLGRFLFEGRRVGIIRKDIPVEIMMEILLGTVEAIMNPLKMTELQLTLQSAFLSIIRVFLEGALTDQGRSRL